MGAYARKALCPHSDIDLLFVSDGGPTVELEDLAERVLYPLWYEWRPVKAFLKRRRPPSRFDVWEGVVA